MGEFSEAYKKTLKPPVTEELINSFFFRPIAFLLVYAVRKTRLTPNHLTLCSLICGLSSGILISFGYFYIALPTLFAYFVFDCSDGQLARLTGKSSKTGKILDVIADIISYFSFFVGSAVHLYNLSANKTVFLLIPVAFIAIALNILFYDQFKNQYIRYVYKNYHEPMESIATLKNQYRNAKGFHLIAGYLYLVVYVIESYIIYTGSLLSIEKHKRVFADNREAPTEVQAAKFEKHFLIITKLWTFLGSGTHFFIVMVLFSVGLGSVALMVFIWYSLIACGVLLIIQNLVMLFYNDR